MAGRPPSWTFTVEGTRGYYFVRAVHEGGERRRVTVRLGHPRGQGPKWYFFDSEATYSNNRELGKKAISAVRRWWRDFVSQAWDTKSDTDFRDLDDLVSRRSDTKCGGL